MIKNIEFYIVELQNMINRELVNLPIPDYPNSLYNPVNYSLKTKGKRIRPILTFIIGQGFGATIEQLFPAALAIEILHTYTLVHDDIMDNDDMRRGLETVHKKWNINTAILSGDAINTLAFRLLMNTNSPNLQKIGIEFTDGMLEICEGQAMDMEFENRIDVGLDEYITMITKKTARLLSMSCKIGGYIAGCDEHTISELSNFAIKTGQAFQIQDDLLEVLSTQAEMGKSLGSDFASEKKTYPMLLTLSKMNPEEKKDFLTFLKKNPDINEVRRIFINSGSIDNAKSKIEKLSNEAIGHLQVCQNETQKTLLELINYLQIRKS